MVVFKRFPINLLPKEKQHLVPLDVRNNYPSFAADFDTLEERLMPEFRDLDREALLQQRNYRQAYIILIFGGSLATIFGIIQIALPNTDWPGYVETIIAFILFVTTTASRSFNNQERYLDKRLAAEHLRSIYFLFLGRYHPFDDENTRVAHLQREIDIIKRRARH